jgi:hypothetical protein
MDEPLPSRPLNLTEREAGELHSLPVEVVDRTVGIRGEDLLRHRLRHKLETLRAGPENFFRLPPLSDIAGGSERLQAFPSASSNGIAREWVQPTAPWAPRTRCSISKMLRVRIASRMRANTAVWSSAGMYLSSQLRLGSFVSTTKSRSWSWRISFQSALMRQTTSELAVTRRPAPLRQLVSGLAKDPVRREPWSRTDAVLDAALGSEGRVWSTLVTVGAQIGPRGPNSLTLATCHRVIRRLPRTLASCSQARSRSKAQEWRAPGSNRPHARCECGGRRGQTIAATHSSARPRLRKKAAAVLGSGVCTSQ